MQQFKYVLSRHKCRQTLNKDKEIILDSSSIKTEWEEGGIMKKIGTFKIYPLPPPPPPPLPPQYTQWMQPWYNVGSEKGYYGLLCLSSNEITPYVEFPQMQYWHWLKWVNSFWRLSPPKLTDDFCGQSLLTYFWLLRCPPNRGYTQVSGPRKSVPFPWMEVSLQ